MPSCTVPQCMNSNANSQYSFFRLPKDEKIRRRWLLRMRVGANFVYTHNQRICSWHFPEGKEKGPTRFKWNEGKLFDLIFPEDPSVKRRINVAPKPGSSQSQSKASTTASVQRRKEHSQVSQNYKIEKSYWDRKHDLNINISQYHEPSHDSKAVKKRPLNYKGFFESSFVEKVDHIITVQVRNVPSKNTSKDKGLYCVNCAIRYDPGRHKNTWSTHIKLNQKRKSHEETVKGALNSMYKFKVTKLFEKSSSSEHDCCNEDDDDIETAWLLCERCSLVANDLYKVYHQFNALRVVNSILSRKLQKLDRLIETRGKSSTRSGTNHQDQGSINFNGENSDNGVNPWNDTITPHDDGLETDEEIKAEVEDSGEFEFMNDDKPEDDDNDQQEEEEDPLSLAPSHKPEQQPISQMQPISQTQSNLLSQPVSQKQLALQQQQFSQGQNHEQQKRSTVQRTQGTSRILNYQPPILQKPRSSTLQKEQNQNLSGVGDVIETATILETKQATMLLPGLQQPLHVPKHQQKVNAQAFHQIWEKIQEGEVGPFQLKTPEYLEEQQSSTAGEAQKLMEYKQRKKISTGRHPCWHCALDFGTVEEVVNHSIELHIKTPDLDEICGFCGRVYFDDWDSFYYHPKFCPNAPEEGEVRPFFKCPKELPHGGKCQMVYRSAKSFSTHLQECPKPPKEPKPKRQKEPMPARQKKVKLEVFQTVVEKREPQKVACPMAEVGCPFVSTNKSKYHLHVQNEHPDISRNCPDCGLDCKLYALLIAHRKKYHGFQELVNFTCEFCGLGFVWRSQLRIHMKDAHANLNLICDQCGQSYKNSGRLQRHKSHVHTEEGKEKFNSYMRRRWQQVKIRNAVLKAAGNRKNKVQTETTSHSTLPSSSSHDYEPVRDQNPGIERNDSLKSTNTDLSTDIDGWIDNLLLQEQN